MLVYVPQTAGREKEETYNSGIIQNDMQNNRAVSHPQVARLSKLNLKTAE